MTRLVKAIEHTITRHENALTALLEEGRAEEARPVAEALHYWRDQLQRTLQAEFMRQHDTLGPGQALFSLARGRGNA